MRGCRSIRLIALSLGMLLLPFGLMGKDKWLSLQTHKFLLVGNAGERDIRQAGVNLEQFRDMFYEMSNLMQCGG